MRRHRCFDRDKDRVLKATVLLPETVLIDSFFLDRQSFDRGRDRVLRETEF